MKPKRVECDQCINFIQATLNDEDNMLSGIKDSAKCKLGKRVMFRMPRFNNEGYFSEYDGGYIRYCNEFKLRT